MTDTQAPAGVTEPHDPDAEAHLIGACLIGGRATVLKVRELVSADAFYLRDRHGLVFATLVDLAGRGAPVDTVTVAAELERNGHLERVGGRATLIALAAIVPAASSAPHYAGIVREREHARRLYRAANAIAKAALNGGVDTHPEIVSELRVALERPADGTVAPLTPLDLEALLAGDPPVVPWIWGEGRHGWLARGDLAIVAGDPGVGKSLLCLAYAIAARREHTFLGDPIEPLGAVGVFDLENPSSEVHSRLYGLGLRWDTVDGIAYFHMPELALAGANAASVLEATIVEHSLELVVLDSFRRLAPGIDENDSGAVSAILTPLRALSARRNVTIVVIHHARKRSEASTDAVQMVRGSGDFSGSVDQLLFLRRKPGETDAFTLEHGKSRRGKEHPSILVRIVGELDDEGEETLRLVSEGEVATTDDKPEQLLARIVEVLEADGGLVERKIIALRLGVDTRDRSLTRALSLGRQRNLIASTERRPGKPVSYARFHDVDPGPAPDEPLELPLDGA